MAYDILYDMTARRYDMGAFGTDSSVGMVL